MKRSALIILNSPFQALCAIEAIEHYEIDEPHFVLFEKDIVRAKTLPIIQDKGVVTFVNHNGNGTLQLIKAVKRVIRNKYNSLFIGDYFSYGFYIVALCVSKFNSKFIYLDDGNSTLSIEPPISRKRGRSKNEKIGFRLASFVARIKSIKSIMFTIYDLSKKFPFPTEKNTFKTLRDNNNNGFSGVYVIGTNSSKLKMKDLPYQGYLAKLAEYIDSKYPQEIVYYCPHRGDNNDYTGFIDRFGWKMFNTQNSVEIDFVRNGIRPLFVVGFGSTALLILKKIFPDTQVSTVRVLLTSEEGNKMYRNIECYFEENGIPTIIFQV